MNSMITKAAGLLLTVAALGACDNPVESERHTGPATISIRAAQQVVVSGTPSSLSAPIMVDLGQTSPVLTVEFRDADGDVMPTTGYWLKVVSTNQAVAKWTPTTPGAFTGTVQGLSAGLTTLTFAYFHGAVDSGHKDGAEFQVSVAVGGAT